VVPGPGGLSARHETLLALAWQIQLPGPATGLLVSIEKVEAVLKKSSDPSLGYTKQSLLADSYKYMTQSIG
jgi:hypothetical protein